MITTNARHFVLTFELLDNHQQEVNVIGSDKLNHFCSDGDSNDKHSDGWTHAIKGDTQHKKRKWKVAE